MLETLKLNVAAIPIGIVPYQKILYKVLTGNALVLENYAGTSIFVANRIMPIPSVIQYTHTNYMPKFTRVLPFNRKNVYIRDRGCCQYCGKKVGLSRFTFDHVLAKCEGGKTCWENIVISCMKCNSTKGRKSVAKFRQPLIQPYAPRLDKAAPLHLVNKVAGEIVEKTWVDYLYWRVILEP